MFINGFVFIITLLITVPILATWIVFKLMKKTTGHPQKALHKAVELTTILYIVSVVFLVGILFEITFIGYVIGMMLIILTFIIIMQYKYAGEITFKKAFKLLWRISFLLFFCAYCILVVWGIVKRIYFA